MTIVGLVGASGYLIYKKVRPGTTVALASPKEGDAKDAGKKTEGEKHTDKHKGSGKPKAEGEEGAEPETAVVKTLEEQQEPGEVAVDPLMETAQTEVAPKMLDALEPEPSEQLTETEPSPETRTLPQEEVAIEPSQGQPSKGQPSRVQPGRLKNRCRKKRILSRVCWRRRWKTREPRP